MEKTKIAIDLELIDGKLSVSAEKLNDELPDFVRPEHVEEIIRELDRVGVAVNMEPPEVSVTTRFDVTRSPDGKHVVSIERDTCRGTGNDFFGAIFDLVGEIKKKLVTLPSHPDSYEKIYRTSRMRKALLSFGFKE